MPNKGVKHRPQKTRAGLANARRLAKRWVTVIGTKRPVV